MYEVVIERAVFTQEKFDVYKLYQSKVHDKDESSDKGGFERFLCQVPLFDPLDSKIPENCSEEEKKEHLLEIKNGSGRIVTSKNNTNPDRLESRVIKDEGVYPKFKGGYHMIHRINGEIMAVGVLDFTHEALSSVYLFYNPKFEFLNPGTLAALKEIEYIKKVSKDLDDKFKFYYLGLYFQDCQKSVYKANFKPSQVACPFTSNYVYLTEHVKKAISAKKKPKLYDLVVN